jgi:uncharacterized protein
MRSLFNGEPSSLSVAAAPAEQTRSTAVEQARNAAAPVSANKPGTDVNALIAAAAQDLADYQRLTAEGKLGEAGQKLEQLKRKLDQLNAHQQ